MPVISGENVRCPTCGSLAEAGELSPLGDDGFGGLQYCPDSTYHANISTAQDTETAQEIFPIGPEVVHA